MKIEKHHGQQVFQPIALQLTIESREELEAVLEMVMSRQQICNWMYTEGILNSTEEDCVLQLFDGLAAALKEA